MKKKLFRGYFLLALLFVIYGTATVPFPKNTVFWIAFVYSAAAFLAQAYVLYDVLKVQVPVKERVYDFAELRIGVLYLVLQAAASLFLMKFSEGTSITIPVYAAALAETLILAAAVAGFYAAKAARAEVIRQDGQMPEKFDKMQKLQSRANLLAGRCQGERIREIVRKLAEEIRYGNPVSKEASAEIEEEIEVLFAELEAAALEEDAESAAEWCRQITELLRERDRICKYGRL